MNPASRVKCFMKENGGLFTEKQTMNRGEQLMNLFASLLEKFDLRFQKLFTIRTLSYTLASS